MLRGADSAALLPALLRTTAGAVGADELLRRTAALLAGSIADWVLADRLAEPDIVVRVAALGTDGPLALPPLAGGDRSRRSSASAGGLLGRLSAMSTPILRLSADELAGLARSADPRLRAQGALAADLGTVEVIVLGTAARGQLNGVLSVGRTHGRFSPDDVAVLELVALHLGVALDAARLLDAQRHVSAVMQTSLLPPLPQVPGLELAARYQAAARGLEVGGDWYDAFSLPDEALAVVIGDIIGHDTAAAARMAELRNQLRALAVDRTESTAATLTRLDCTGRALGRIASGTCLYARLERDGAGWRMRWSSAGHLPPVLVRAGQTQLVETPPDLMLGVDPDCPRTEHAAHLAPGDLLLLCTDGLVEDRRIPLGERLEVLRDLVGQHADDHPDSLADALLTALAEGAEDDVALLVAKVGG